MLISFKEDGSDLIHKGIKRLFIEIDSVEFKLTVNNEGFLVINKSNHSEKDNGSDTIVISPSCSNEIRIK